MPGGALAVVTEVVRKGLTDSDFQVESRLSRECLGEEHSRLGNS